jgi:hypothetical protein
MNGTQVLIEVVASNELVYIRDTNIGFGQLVLIPVQAIVYIHWLLTV